jgi:hypothetical protein
VARQRSVSCSNSNYTAIKQNRRLLDFESSGSALIQLKGTAQIVVKEHCLNASEANREEKTDYVWNASAPNLAAVDYLLQRSRE